MDVSDETEKIHGTLECVIKQLNYKNIITVVHIFFLYILRRFEKLKYTQGVLIKNISF